MRTIKFRGKILELNLGCKMNVGDWVYGDLHLLSKIPHIHTINNKYIINTETIGQYTGLQDKNDVEIYEGDIVRVSCVPVKYIGTNAISYIVDCICVFFQGSFLYKRISPFDKQKLSRNWTYKPMNRLDIKEVEVIGNIHDNPELLKGE